VPFSGRNHATARALSRSQKRGARLRANRTASGAGAAENEEEIRRRNQSVARPEQARAPACARAHVQSGSARVCTPYSPSIYPTTCVRALRERALRLGVHAIPHVRACARARMHARIKHGTHDRACTAPHTSEDTHAYACVGCVRASSWRAWCVHVMDSNSNSNSNSNNSNSNSNSNCLLRRQKYFCQTDRQTHAYNEKALSTRDTISGSLGYIFVCMRDISALLTVLASGLYSTSHIRGCILARCERTRERPQPGTCLSRAMEVVEGETETEAEGEGDRDRGTQAKGERHLRVHARTPRQLANDRSLVGIASGDK
jgi:hypothetical protein